VNYTIAVHALAGVLRYTRGKISYIQHALNR